MTYRRDIQIMKSVLGAIMVSITIRTAGKNHTFLILSFSWANTFVRQWRFLGLNHFSTDTPVSILNTIWWEPWVDDMIKKDNPFSKKILQVRPIRMCLSLPLFHVKSLVHECFFICIAIIDSILVIFWVESNLYKRPTLLNDYPPTTTTFTSPKSFSSTSYPH